MSVRSVALMTGGGVEKERVAKQCHHCGESGEFERNGIEGAGRAGEGQGGCRETWLIRRDNVEGPTEHEMNLEA
jgi:hypothetical protein